MPRRFEHVFCLPLYGAGLSINPTSCGLSDSVAPIMEGVFFSVERRYAPKQHAPEPLCPEPLCPGGRYAPAYTLRLETLCP